MFNDLHIPPLMCLLHVLLFQQIKSFKDLMKHLIDETLTLHRISLKKYPAPERDND
jgi:hypothetical protein